MSRYPLCTQDHCALQDRGASADLVAELALAALSGRELQDVVGERNPIFPRKQCGDCLRQVMAGRRPFATEEQRSRDERAGRASYRRHRRREVREAR